MKLFFSFSSSTSLSCFFFFILPFLIQIFYTDICICIFTFPGGWNVKKLSAIWETGVQSPGWEDLLKKEIATHSSTLAWRIPWTEEPGGLESMGMQRVRHDWGDLVQHSNVNNNWSSLRVPWTARRFNQYILKEISLGCSLEGLMLKLKLQSLGHLMWRTDSFWKDPDAGKDWAWEEKGTAEDEMVGWHHWLNGHEFG